MAPPSLQKQVWIDGLRVFASFCVVFLHTESLHVTRFGSKDWAIANICDGVVSIGVPCS